ncbi:MAG: hypothetical protein HONBIEJF_01142 [Fimbriimonadaceae bacterium]|nr:hypothetical protein [Fimbriimonadaceae bacterium]
MGLFPEWTWVVGFYIGAAIGSFLNVVIYRLPLGLSLGKPRHSFCPSCKHRLGPMDLLPIVSWLLSRGRCRHCGARISSRYLWVEVFTGSLFAITWYQHLCAGWDVARAIALMVFVAALVAAIFIDLRWFIIPDQINAVMLFAGLGLMLAQMAQGKPAAWEGAWPAAIVGALTGIAAIWGIALIGLLLFRKDAMGHGDIKMARGIGAVLLWKPTLLSIGVAVVFGAVAGIFFVLAKRFFATSSAANETLHDSVECAGQSTHNTNGEADEEEEPESVGSLVRCGIGYVLCIDVIGLAIPGLYERWFGENPYATEDVSETEDAPAPITMIPFGPCLALGALLMALTPGWIEGLVERYWHWATGGR